MARVPALPHVRQEPVHRADRCGRDVREHTGEVALGIKAMAFGAGNQAVEGRGGLAIPIVASEQLVLGVRSANSTSQYGDKITRQMGPRGWTDNLVDEAISRPHATSAATNKATGGKATAYFRQDGSYVVRDNASREIIQVSNRNNPKWIPDSSIQHPYYPK